MIIAIILSFIGAMVLAFLMSNLTTMLPFLSALTEQYFIHPMMTVIFVVALAGLIFATLQYMGLLLEILSNNKGFARSGLVMMAKLTGRPNLGKKCLNFKEQPLSESKGATLLKNINRLDRQPLAVIEFFIWLLPLLGFVGTIIGITGAMEQIGFLFENQGQASYQPVLIDLATAFYTTLFALVSVIPLMIFYYILQAKTERLEELRYEAWQEAQNA